ncbi:MAG: hypothetical protein M1444_04290 [Patescibacteria group bacterium]|nr:hypothetical protein [Patescibacteria group bacterium]
MKELKPIEESWNKKRIFFALTVLVILIAGLAVFKVLALDKSQNFPQNSATKNLKAVKGVSTDTNSPSQNNSVTGLKTTIQDQLDTIKQEASGINLAEIATSSPQVQKVIDDIKSIQNLPKDQAKSFCQQICSGL